MRFFQESICDCCFCPMQCALKEFIQEEVNIFTLFGNISPLVVNIFTVEDFIVMGTSANGEEIIIPVSKILYFNPVQSKQINLKPIQRNIKGTCTCLEDSITSKFKINETVNVGRLQGVVRAVGEGVVILNNEAGQNIVSTCNGVIFVDNIGTVSNVVSK
ncbi:hypothetical protein [Chengkuizengella axinellae]|uniref:Uncharacterized protein n=1 Tax=Chengkuizengella axinellae TaxID=3064388 RepID=A0ABT9J1S4_9BACL|nr:hypothetical protein [Chengkuizengella sp. 2205SS18-9]MDP5275569.1 hypothetical protein [Chengkuizengella sp. 2205SS18-9]